MTLTDKTDDDIRTISSTLGVLHIADGSARWQFGSTSVLASVNGPIEVRIRDEQVDKATLEIVFRPADKTAGTGEKVLEKMIRNTFGSAIMTNLNPRTLIQIVVQVEHDDGGVLAASVNAVQLALLDAGISLRYMVAALSCKTDAESLVIDPTKSELSTGSLFTFAFTNTAESKSQESPVLVDSVGSYTDEEFASALDSCRKGTAKIQDYMRLAVSKRM